MNTRNYLAAILAAAFLAACSKAPEEKPPEIVQSAEDTAEPAAEQPKPEAPKKLPAKREYNGHLEVTGNEAWNMSEDGVQLTCLRSVNRRPFRAQWFDAGTKIGLAANGMPQADGSGVARAMDFRLTSLAGSNVKDVELTDTRIWIEELSNEGASTVFEVTATGKIEGGGLFMATGKCRA